MSDTTSPTAAAPQAPTATDRIEREVLLKSPRSRVWRALSDAEEFGQWFGVRFAGQRFTPGQVTRGQITYPGYEHVTMEVQVQRVEPEHLLSFHWHPYAIQPGVDFSHEPPTLVEFTLHDAPGGGTRVKVVESGFDRIPAARRDEAFRMNAGGWTAQMANIQRHVDAA